MTNQTADFECLPTAIRAWAVPTTPDPPADTGSGRGPVPPWRPAERVRRSPHRVLVFDTETTTDHTQRLLYGVWRIYTDKQHSAPARTCIEEGIFYADDLPDRDPVGYALLQSYALNRKADTSPGQRPTLRLLSRTEFVDHVLWPWAYQRQGTVVGFNLPFDLTRLATYCSPARGRNRGGISLRLWDYDGGENTFRPRVVLKNIDGVRTLMSFTQPRDAEQFYRGRFLDLRTLAFAHTNDGGLSLEGACERFGVNFTKADVALGEITAETIDYCRADVDATTRLYRALHDAHRCHPIELAPERCFSPATLGKAYWRTGMNIPPFRDRTELDPVLMGWGMEAFYGGRAECHIRKVDVPVVYVDFRSMYMTCNALMNTWPLITAQQINPTPCTTEIRELLDAPNLAERCFDPDLWTRLHVLVEIDPNGATLPVRALYDNVTDSWGIGINPYQSDRPCWYPLADVIAAHLLDGPNPIVHRAIRLEPTGQLTDLKTVELCGEIPINPAREDFFRAVVEHRYRCRNDPNRTQADRTRLNQFLKVLGNATGFGILAQLVRQPSDPTTVDVHAGEGTPFTVTTNNPEEPGEYCYPPIAATLTGAARLMLALLEHQVTKSGGTYAFCDTDSMAIVATRTSGHTFTSDDGEPIPTLSWAQVDDIVIRFEALNPYDPEVVPGSILEIEDENFHPNTNKQRQLRCFAISAKRYQLTTPDGDTIKWSEHGLGHLLNPTPTNDTGWINQAWQWLRNPHDAEPEWLDLPAVSRLTVASPDMHHWFHTTNQDRPYSDQIKPGNFLLVAHPNPLDPAAATGSQPVAQYERSPTQWASLPWIDRTTGQQIRVRTGPIDGIHRPDTITARTYRDVLDRYLRHPEAKFLAPDSGRVRGGTTGTLHRRSVRAVLPIQYIGKEANELQHRAAGLCEDNTNCYNPTERDWYRLVVPTLRAIPTATIACRTGLEIRTIQRARAGHCIPRPMASAALFHAATEHAFAQSGRRRRSDPRSTLYAFLAAHAPDPDDLHDPLLSKTSRQPDGVSSRQIAAPK